MWSSSIKSFTKVVVGVKGAKGTRIIHTEDLSKNSSATKVKKLGDNYLAKSPLIGKGIEEEKSVIRVKVKMTKEEASKLISKCKNGGVLEFKDVANDLLQIPINRINVVSPSNSCFDAALATIHEEI